MRRKTKQKKGRKRGERLKKGKEKKGKESLALVDQHDENWMESSART